MTYGHEVAVGYVSIIPETGKLLSGIRKAMSDVDRVMAGVGSGAISNLKAGFDGAFDAGKKSAKDFSAIVKAVKDDVEAAARAQKASEQELAAVREATAAKQASLHAAEMARKAAEREAVTKVEEAERRYQAAVESGSASEQKLATLKANVDKAREQTAIKVAKATAAEGEAKSQALSATRKLSDAEAAHKVKTDALQQAKRNLEGATRSAAAAEKAAAAEATRHTGVLGRMQDTVSRVGARMRGLRGDMAAASMPGGFSAASGAASSMIGVVGRLGGAIGALAGPTSVFMSGWKRATALQEAEVRFKSMGVVGQEFTDTMQIINQVVKGTSAGLDQASREAAMLMTSGVKGGEELKNALEAMVTASAAGGSELSDLGLVFRQVAAAGKLQAEDANQLQERSIPIWAWLGKTMGKSIAEVRDMASEGQVSFEDMVKAIKENGGSLAKDMSATFGGQVSLVKSSMARLGQIIAEPIMDIGVRVLPVIAAGFDKVTAAIKKFGAWLGSGSIAADVFKVAIAALGGAMVGLAVKSMVPLIGTLGGLTKAFLVNTAAFMATPFGWVAAGIGAIVAAFVLLWRRSETFRDFWTGIWNSIKSAVGTAVEWIKSMFDDIKAAWEEITTAFRGGDFGFGQLAAWFGDGAAKKITDFAAAAGDAWRGFKDQAKVAFDSVKNKAQQVWDAISGFTGDLFGDLPGTLQAIGERLQPVVDGLGALAGVFRDAVWSTIKDLFSTLKDTLSAVGGVFVSVGQSMWQSLKAIGEAVGGAVVSTLQAFWEVIKSVGQALWDIVKAVWPVLWPVLKIAGMVIGGLIVGAIWIALKAVQLFAKALAWLAKNVLPVVLAPIKIVANIFQWVAQNIIPKVISVVSWLAQAFMKVLVGAIKIAGGVISGIFNALKAVWDVVVAGFKIGFAIVKGVFGVLVTVAKYAIGICAALFGVLLGVWNVLVAGFQWAWENVMKPAWDAIGTAAQWMWDNALKPAWDAIQAGWNKLVDGIKWAWENLLKPAWDAIGLAAQWMWTNVLQPVWVLIQTAWDMLLNALKFAWESILKPAWDAISLAAQWMWNGVLMPVWEAIKAGWNGLVNGIQWAWNNLLKPAWDAMQAAAQWMWNNVIKPAWDAMKAAWEGLGSGIQWVWESVIRPAWDALKSGIDSVKNAFQAGVDKIKSIWNGLRSALAAPINFMIDKVVNNGVVKAWNGIGGKIGLPELPTVGTIPEYATGGRIVGPGTGTSDDVLMWGSNGEHVITAAEVRRAGGHNAIYVMRDLISRGIPFEWDGGRVLDKLGRKNVRNFGSAIRRQGVGKADPQGVYNLLPKLPRHAGGGEVLRPAWMDQLDRAHEWAKSRNGRPYVLGGSANGSGGTDCSGFMSGIANVIQGGDGRRQWATMAFNGGGNSQYPSGPQGFVAGLGKGFSIGVTNGGPAGGHTAGTLSSTSRFNAVNVESGGSHGNVAYGGPAVGADHVQFKTHYHLPIGADGGFESGGAGGGPSPQEMQATIKKILDKAFEFVLKPVRAILPKPPPEWKTVPGKFLDKSKEELYAFAGRKIDGLGGLTRSAWERAKEYGGKIASLFRDQGGYLPDGLSLVRNETGKPEAVFNWDQLMQMQRMIESTTKLLKEQAKATDKVAAVLPQLVPLQRQGTSDRMRQLGLNASWGNWDLTNLFDRTAMGEGNVTTDGGMRLRNARYQMQQLLDATRASYQDMLLREVTQSRAYDSAMPAINIQVDAKGDPKQIAEEVERVLRYQGRVLGRR